MIVRPSQSLTLKIKKQHTEMKKRSEERMNVRLEVVSGGCGVQTAAGRRKESYPNVLGTRI